MVRKNDWAIRILKQVKAETGWADFSRALDKAIMVLHFENIETTEDASRGYAVDAARELDRLSLLAESRGDTALSDDEISRVAEVIEERIAYAITKATAQRDEAQMSETKKIPLSPEEILDWLDWSANSSYDKSFSSSFSDDQRAAYADDADRFASAAALIRKDRSSSSKADGGKGSKKYVQHDVAIRACEMTFTESTSTTVRATAKAKAQFKKYVSAAIKEANAR